jgi:transposase InsO family protein
VRGRGASPRHLLPQAPSQVGDATRRSSGSAEQAQDDRGRRGARHPALAALRRLLAGAGVLHPPRRGQTYLASESTFYRILRANDEVRERRAQSTHPPKKKPELVATAPNVCWSRDITKLRGPRRGEYYDCYVVLDIFSRYVVAWCVARESGELAKELIADAVRRHRVPAGSAHDPCRSRIVDDVEPGRRALHVPRHQAQP